MDSRKNIDLAAVIGYILGDGSVYLRKNLDGTYDHVVALGMRDKEAVEDFNIRMTKVLKKKTK